MTISCENIGLCATNVMAANLLFFAGLAFFWEKKAGTQRGSIWAFILFLMPFVLTVASVILAVCGIQSCRFVFCCACFLDLPLVVATWMHMNRSGNDRKNLEAKIGEE